MGSQDMENGFFDNCTAYQSDYKHAAVNHTVSTVVGLSCFGAPVVMSTKLLPLILHDVDDVMQLERFDGPSLPKKLKVISCLEKMFSQKASNLREVSRKKPSMCKALKGHF